MLKKYYDILKRLSYPFKLAKFESTISFLAFWFHFFQDVYKIQILSFIVAAISAKNLNELYFWIWVFVFLNIFTYLFVFIWTLFDWKLHFKLTFKLHSLYLKKFIGLDNNKIESLWTWRINNIIIKWIDNWVDIYINYFSNFAFSIVAIAYSFWIILYTNWIKYFLLIFAIFCLMILIIAYWNNLSLKYRKIRKDETIEYDRNILKIIMSKFEILQNNRFADEENKLGAWIKKILNARIKEDTIWSAWSISVNLITDTIKVILFLTLGAWVVLKKIELSNFILIYWLIDIIESYSWSISRSIKSIWMHIVEVDKLIDTFENIAEIPWINNPTPFKHAAWNILLKGLTYWYNDDNIFNDLNLEIKWWMKTAFVWDSWSWKTTLMKLVAWYVHPKDWEVIVDGQNIQDINLISYYKNIWYLTQDPSVFDGTIKENLLYALDREPTQDEIVKTIKNSKCEFIYELKNWLETEIWERWVKLSWWQKQRLAIAKIMLKNPKIILLDEPTSALDSISEQIVSEALHNLFAGRTVIVIAHRLQTVKEADEILVFKKWEIIERWTHIELSQKENWEYKKMLELQTSF